MRPLTDKQQTILGFVRTYCQEQGFPPTFREIGEGVGLANVSAVRGHVAALEKKGYLSRDPDKARSIRLLRSPSLLSRFKKRLHKFAQTDEGVLHRVIFALAVATRDRKAVFAGPQKGWLSEALDRRAVEHGWRIMDKRIEVDHVALVVEVWPNHSADLVVSRVRQAGSAVRRRHAGAFPEGPLWARGYAVTTDPGQLDEMLAQLLGEAGAKA